MMRVKISTDCLFSDYANKIFVGTLVDS
jgi:hypothetical protein